MKKILAIIISKICIGYYKVRYGKNIIWGKNVIVNHKFSFSGQGTLCIDDHVNLWAHEESNRFQTFSAEAKIVLGKNSRINGVLMQCREGIEIGEDCLLGSAHIMDTDFHHVDTKKRQKNTLENIPTKKIVVGNNVWIAGQSAVLKGVIIGENAVVGFRSVVAKNVERNVVVAGNPARVIKEI